MEGLNDINAAKSTITDQRVIELTRIALEAEEKERNEHNLFILEVASLQDLFKLRDAARVMESLGYRPEVMASSQLLNAVIRMRK